MAKKVVLVGIGGASSSGKTTLAKLLHKVSKDSILLHQDDFYKKDAEIPIDKDSGYQNWDCAGAINFEAFVKEILYLKKTGELSRHSHEIRYDSDTKDQITLEFPDLEQIIERLNRLVIDKNVKLVFVDGFMIFHDAKIVELFDLKLFLTANYDTLKQRRYARSGYQTQDSFWVDPPEYFEKIVYPAYSDSHSYLFDRGVESETNEHTLKELDVNSLKNDRDTVLSEVFDWGFDILLKYISNL